MAFRKISQLPEALSLEANDLFLLSDMLGLTSRRIRVETLGQVFGTYDLNGRYREGSSWEITRDSDGFVTTVATQIGSVTKTYTFNRDMDSSVNSVQITTSDSSYTKTYTFVRSEGVVTSIQIT